MKKNRAVAAVRWLNWSTPLRSKRNLKPGHLAIWREGRKGGMGGKDGREGSIGGREGGREGGIK